MIFDEETRHNTLNNLLFHKDQNTGQMNRKTMTNVDNLNEGFLKNVEKFNFII